MGEQRLNNYALLAPDKKTFVDLVTVGQAPAPEHFVYDDVLNRQDRDLLDENALPEAVYLEEFERLVEQGVMVVHIEGSLHVSGGTLEMNIERKMPDLDATVLCYCNAVNRGALSAATLKRMGYRNAWFIDGGLNGYREVQSN